MDLSLCFTSLTLVALAAQEDRLTVHAAPRPLAREAVVEDWPGFLGPRRDGHVRERPLDLRFRREGPKLLWELRTGEGFASPVVAGQTLVFTHRVEDEARIEARHAETGALLWEHALPCSYGGKYIEDSGPRSTPQIVEDRVFVHGVEGELMAFELATGELLWERNTTKEYRRDHGFFGVVSSPLAVGDHLIQMIGAREGPTVLCLDLATGETVWEAGDTWGASCSSPVLAELGGEPCVLVLAGGDSRPPVGGLFVLDLATGAVRARVPFRSNLYASVSGATPLVVGERIVLSSAYGVGTHAFDLVDGRLERAWENGIELQFSSPLLADGVVYAIDGVSQRSGALVAVDPATGDETWRTSLSFEEVLEGKTGEEREFTFSVGEGSFLVVDDLLLALGDYGHLAVLDPGRKGARVRTWASLFHAPETWTPPVVSHGLLYVCQNRPGRSGEGQPRLLCYDLRGR